MKIPGKTMDDHLADVAQRLPADNVSLLRDVDCEADVVTTEAMLHFRSDTDPTYPNRPYLRFLGEARALRGDLSHGVREIEFQERSGIPVDVFYEFTDEEISDMALKGLFNKGFETPDIFKENLVEIPVKANLAIVEPYVTEGVPIIFADIEGRKEIQISEQTCGYRFGDYFEAITPIITFEEETEMTLEDWDVEDYFKPELEEDMELDSNVDFIDEQEIDPESLRIKAHVDNVEKRVLSRMDKSSEKQTEISDDLVYEELKIEDPVEVEKEEIIEVSAEDDFMDEFEIEDELEADTDYEVDYEDKEDLDYDSNMDSDKQAKKITKTTRSRSQKAERISNLEENHEGDSKEKKDKTVPSYMKDIMEESEKEDEADYMEIDDTI